MDAAMSSPPFKKWQDANKGLRWQRISRFQGFRGLISCFSLPQLWLNARSVVLEGLHKRDAHERKAYGGASMGGG